MGVAVLFSKLSLNGYFPRVSTIAIQFALCIRTLTANEQRCQIPRHSAQTTRTSSSGEMGTAEVKASAPEQPGLGRCDRRIIKQVPLLMVFGLGICP